MFINSQKFIDFIFEIHLKQWRKNKIDNREQNSLLKKEMHYRLISGIDSLKLDAINLPKRISKTILIHNLEHLKVKNCTNIHLLVLIKKIHRNCLSINPRSHHNLLRLMENSFRLGKILNFLSLLKHLFHPILSLLSFLTLRELMRANYKKVFMR